VRFTPANLTHVPKQVGGGDTEFRGHGPRVVADVTLATTPSSLTATVFMDAKETTSDWTEAAETKVFALPFVPEPGWKIDGVVGPTHSHWEYVDSNHDEDSFGPGGPVARMTFVGDTDGDEAGSRTRVEVAFNQLQIALTQTKDCVPADAVHKLETDRRISPAVLGRLAPAAAAMRRNRAEMLVRPLPGE
jgi:hypothetical protein